MMKNKILILIVGASLLSGFGVFGTAAEQNWKWQREIKPDEASRFNRFEISPEIYAKSQLSLGDLRIVDDQKNGVPYILDAQRGIIESNQAAAPFKLVKSFRRNNDTSFDFSGVVLAGMDQISNRLTVTLGYEGDFFKYIELYGSYDGTRWEWIGNDSLYRVAGSADNELSLDTPQKYTAYRIVLLDNVEGISLTGLSGSLISASEKLSTRKIIFNTDHYSRSENGTTTEIRLKGFRNLPVRTLSIEAEGLFHRPCRVVSGDEAATGEVFGNGYLYQSTLTGTEPLKNTLSVTVSQPYESMLLIIDNGDNPPLKIQNITLEYAADALIFEPQKNKTYSLQYGNLSAATPQYDLEQFKNEISQQSIGTAVLLAEFQIPESGKTDPSFPVSQKTIFSAVIFAVALLLGWLAVHGMKAH